VPVFHILGDQDRDGLTEEVQVPAADGQGPDGEQDAAAADGVQVEGFSNGELQFPLLILSDQLPFFLR